MYLTGRSPYLDSSLLCSNYRNIIRVILLGNHSTSYWHLLQSVPYLYYYSLSTESPVASVYKALLYNYYLSYSKYYLKLKSLTSILPKATTTTTTPSRSGSRQIDTSMLDVSSADTE